MTRRNRNVVLGLGRTGLSVARYLSGRGETVAVVDTRVEPPELPTLRRELPDVPVFLGGWHEAALGEADRIIVSPGVSLAEPALAPVQRRGAELVGDIELFAGAATAPVVAITGSNGKSTVTTLVERMASNDGWRVRAGGNLGPPALDLLPREGEAEPELYVLELSSFQLESTQSLRPKAAAVLNIATDHLDRYASLDAYARAKERIFRGAGTAIVNLDDPRVAGMDVDGSARRGFRLGEPPADGYGLTDHDGRSWLVTPGGRLMPVAELALAGRHNLANALAAVALADAIGIGSEAMRGTLTRFVGLPHRTELAATIDGVRYVDDSKATNLGACLAAVEGLDGPVVLIAGGEAKDRDFSQLRSLAPRPLKAAVLIGRDAELLAQALGEVVPVTRAATMTAAVRAAAGYAEPGDTVLLSPACASFDMFTDYAERGRQFVDAVREQQG